MSRTTRGSGKMLSKDQIGSPSIDEGSSGASMVGGGGSGLKKGPWTSVEDAILVEYVKKHGEGNWNAVQKHSGLSRCGKSCRLRWANHLRPNLRKGAFTQEEENIIIELHARMGNKWARMATHLPGRTDNEIKNYWNTRIKRRLRAGLPVYPPNIPLSSSDENHQGQNFGELSNGDKMQNEVLQGNGYDIPDFTFNGYNVSYVPPFSEIPVNNLLSQGFGSQNYGFVGQSLDHKRLRLHETLFPVYPAAIGSRLLVFENFSNDPSEKTEPTLGEASYPYDPDPYEGSIPGGHALIMNDINSTSRSLLRTVKLELPSLQYTETESPSSWFETDALDPYVQSPLALSTQSECSSPWNSGLLEEVLHESQALHTGKKQFPDKSSNSSAMTPSDLMDSAANNFYDETALEEDCDPISPLGCSAASVCNEFTPPISGGSGSDIMSPNAAGLSTPNTVEMDVKPKLLRPDALLGYSWLYESSQTKDHNELNNAIAALLGDDCSSEHKPTIAGTSSSFTGILGLDSFRWNNMPRVCQMSEIP